VSRGKKLLGGRKKILHGKTTEGSEFLDLTGEAGTFGERSDSPYNWGNQGKEAREGEPRTAINQTGNSKDPHAGIKLSRSANRRGKRLKTKKRVGEGKEECSNERVW